MKVSRPAIKYPGMPLQPVTDRDFEQQVLQSELPVLVDLYADWCQPCKALEPILNEVSAELAGKLKVVRVDIEKNPLLARGFRVQSIPMLVLIHQGRPVDQLMGLVDKNAILELVRPVLPASSSEITPKELAVLIQQKRVVPVDIRDARAFGRYRIPTAINVPMEEVATKIEELIPRDGRLRILYARSTDDAKQLAEQLQQQGVQIGYLNGGFLHWEADGLDVERGS